MITLHEKNVADPAEVEPETSSQLEADSTEPLRPATGIFCWDSNHMVVQDWSIYHTCLAVQGYLETKKFQGKSGGLC